MKRGLTLIVILVIAMLSLVACSNNADSGNASSGESSTGGAKPLIGVSMTTLSQSIYVLEADALKAKFPDYDVQVSSADDDVSTQISQINNFILQGAEMIVVTPTEIEAIADVVKTAYDAGIKVVINGSAGDASLLEGKFTTCTVSDEYLIGEYVALVAKNWADANMDPNGDWEVCFMIASLNDDTLLRSAGLQSILREYLENSDGEYVDAMGNVVEESKRVENPAYSKMVADHFKGAVVEQDMSQSNYTTVSNAMTSYPNARLFIAFNSLASTEGGQYIVDKFPNELDDFGFFSAGVMGDEPDYLVGSLSETEGTLSVFRGACEFGGGDVAAALADLAYRVMNGEEGVDFAKETPQGIGVWWGVNENWSGDGVATLANMDILNAVTVTAFDPIESLKTATTFWDSENGFNKDAAAPPPPPGMEGEGPGGPEGPESSGPENPAEVVAGTYTFDETTPFDAVVVWTLTLNEDNTFTLHEANPDMGDTEYTGDSWTDNGDGTVTTSPLQGGKPLGGFFESDYSCTWALLKDGHISAVKYDNFSKDVKQYGYA